MTDRSADNAETTMEVTTTMKRNTEAVIARFW